MSESAKPREDRPARDEEWVAAAKIVNNLVKAAKEDLRLGWMIGLNDHQIGEILQDRKDESEGKVRRYRRQAIDAMLYGISGETTEGGDE